MIEQWLDGASTQPGVGCPRPELETHLRNERSTFSWLLEPMIVQAGFIIKEAEYSDSQIFTGYTCVKRGWATGAP